MLLEEFLAKYVVPISTVFSNIMVGLVPIIVGWMRYFSTNIKVIGQTSGASVFDGESYSLKLENKTLRNFVIDKINVFVNQEQFFTINLEKLDFEKRTLEPFKQLIVNEHWTTMQNCLKKSSLYGVKFEIFCGDKVILIKHLSFWQQLRYNNFFFKYLPKKSPRDIKNNLILNKHYFNGKIISKQVKYALHLFNQDNVFERTVLITENGFMSDNIILNDQKRGKTAYNALPPEEIKTTEQLINYLGSELFKSSIHKFVVQEVGK